MGICYEQQEKNCAGISHVVLRRIRCNRLWISRLVLCLSECFFFLIRDFSHRRC